MAADGSIHPLQNIDPIDRDIGARIRLRRKQMHISQSALAARLEVSFQQVQKYERGANRISGSTLVRAAQALEISVGWLVGETQDAPQLNDEIAKLLACHFGQELVTLAKDLKPQFLASLVNVARSLSEAG